jgi:competence protein ComFB
MEKKRLGPQLENQMERAVIEVINEIVLLETQNRFCICDKFRADVAALALNQLHPRYATTFQGSLFTLESIQADQDLQVIIRKEVLSALEQVIPAPRCQEPDCPLQGPTKAEVDLELIPASGE